MFENANVSRRSFVKAGLAGAAVSAMGVCAGALANEPAQDNRICSILGIQKPVIQALMNELTSPELASAVSNAGGLGILGLPTREDIQATKALTQQPFGIAQYPNFLDDEYIQMLEDEGVDIILLAGFNADVVKSLKERGFKVIVKILVPEVDANPVEVSESGADIIALVGYGAGGCGPNLKVPFFDLLSEYRDSVTCAIAAGGGIVNGATATAAAAMGADGVYCGSAFLASEESPVCDAAKQIICETRAQDMVEFPVGFGMMRATNTERSQLALQMVAEGADPYDIHGAVVGWAPAMRDGNFDEFFVNCGSGVNLITEIRPAAAIVDDLASAFNL